MPLGDSAEVARDIVSMASERTTQAEPLRGFVVVQIMEETGQNTEAEQGQTQEAQYKDSTFRGFLEQMPPDVQVRITDFKQAENANYVVTPDVLLFCDYEDCDGPRMF